MNKINFFKYSILAASIALTLGISGCHKSNSNQTENTGGTDTGGTDTGGTDTGGTDTGGTDTGGTDTGGGDTSIDLTVSDFNRQTYVINDEGDLTILSFEDSGNVGFEFTEVTTGTAPNFIETRAKQQIGWSIVNGKLNVTFANGESTTVTLLSKNGNTYNVSATDPDGGSSLASLLKTLPLNISDLNGKILALDTSQDDDCSARTIKVTGTNAVIKESCTEGYSKTQLTLSPASKLDNTIYLNFPDNSKIKSNLISGDLATGGQFSFIFNPSQNVPDDIEFENFTSSDKEVYIDWTAEMSNNKTYYWAACEADTVVEKQVIKPDGTATYGTSTSDTYTHSIDANGHFVNTFPGETPETLTLLEINSNYLFLRSSEVDVYRYYFQQSEAEAYCSSISSHHIDWTTEMSNNKTYYVPVCTEAIKVEKEFYKADGTGTVEVISGTEASTELEPFTHSITENGSIHIEFSGEGGEAGDIDTSEIVEKNSIFLRLIGNDSESRRYFQQSNAEAYCDSLSNQ